MILDNFGKIQDLDLILEKDQPSRPLGNVLGRFLWLKIAQNEIQQLALFEIAASMHSPFCPNLADLAACVLLALQKGCAR